MPKVNWKKEQVYPLVYPDKNGSKQVGYFALN